MEVPSQWSVTGGMARYPAGKIGLHEGARSIFVATSPDSKIVITSGDINVPSFTTPAEVTRMSGFDEGSWMNGFQIMSYMTGAQFAEWYVNNFLAQEYGYTDLVITQRRNLPEMSQAINDDYAKYRLPMKMDYGDVYFTCQKDGQRLSGYYLASTRLASPVTETLAGWTLPAVWNVPVLDGYVSTPSEAALANAVLAHIFSSSRDNTNWLSKEISNAANGAQASAKANEEVSDMIMETYQSRTQSEDNSFRNWQNAYLGNVDVRNEETGDTYKVEAGHNYYWANADRIAGTETYDRPNIDFTPLQEY